jgi:hypothetical protein
MQQRALATLTFLRAVGGVGNWFAPALTGRVFGFEHDRSRDLLNRLTGAREMAFAAGPALARGEARRQWLRLALACDTLDTAAVALMLRAGQATPAQAAGVAAFSVGCGALTALLLAGGSDG